MYTVEYGKGCARSKRPEGREDKAYQKKNLKL